MDTMNVDETLSPVFKGLLRPATFWGVDYHAFLCIGLIAMLAFINTSRFSALLIALPLYALAWVGCQRDPCIMGLLMARANLVQPTSIKGARCKQYVP